ncbi:Sec-independent protein translocase TatB [Microbacterium dauci]|uniref:Sec-independent protein translocase TatB n=1 Tax=Microbacterium dauci TaxID=3048008 RepID=A0ABT6ZDB3_9MICO|nr:Sec-independent protein translocase TatB [Microbacterium sp. LX3-4]MDJ1113908.1 Sec-independent protein translocase TatB [Microbacterium sp. LX3-4]
MFGLSFEKLVLVALLAAMIIGPSRLPALAQRLADLIRGLRGLVDAARVRAETEVGLTADDWRSLDPRQYDPRRIVREALVPEPVVPAGVAPMAARARSAQVTGSSGHPRRLFAAASVPSVSAPPDADRGAESAPTDADRVDVG